MVNGQVRMNRFYALESTPNVTGTLADFRLPASPARMRAVLDALAQAIVHNALPQAAGLSPAESQFVTMLAADLRKHAPAVVCVAGPEEEADIQRWAQVVERGVELLTEPLAAVLVIVEVCILGSGVFSPPSASPPPSSCRSVPSLLRTSAGSCPAEL